MQEFFFDEILKKYTEYDFHDAHIKSIKYDYEEKYLQFNIIHYREPDDEIEISSIIKFLNVDNVTVEDFADSRNTKLFFCNSEILSFNEDIINDKKTYKLTARKWRLEFSAERINYTETVDTCIC